MNAPNVKDILELINRDIPFELAEEWDNCGLQCGHPDWEVSKIITALDVTLPVLERAVGMKADLVLTHHPLMISSFKQVNFSTMPGSAIHLSAKHKVAVVSVHTNLDAARNGLNDYFASIAGVTPERAMIPAAVDASTQASLISAVDEYQDMPLGIGRIGKLAQPTTLDVLARDIKQRFRLDHVRIGGNTEQLIHDAAICTGSGGTLASVFLKSGAQVYITGDIKYHEARLIEEHNLSFIDVGHFGSEHIAVDLLKTHLARAITDAGFKIDIIGYKNEQDPFITI
ncbi:MAG: Nif3-like dinuclear metal center hexameric protein [Desulfobacteraceae bacterium]|nr:MAG: Nif3-like dinuclear metal center hexameric protein [Desulfobacteraceae bacterium]